MDTPGLADAKLRAQAAQAISEALKNTGNYRIFFVITLEAGRVRPTDVATIRLVTDALCDIKGVCYSIIINKLEEVELEMLNENENGAVDDLMASLMGDDMPVKTSNIYYMPRMDKLAKAKKGVEYVLPNSVFEFIMMAPRVFVDADKVHDVKPDEFAEMEAKFESQIQLLEGNLEEQKAVNARNQQALEEQKKIIEESQKQAAADRAKFKAELDIMKDDHAKEAANAKEEHQRLIQRMKQDAAKKSEEDKKEMLERVQQMDKDHKATMQQMQSQHSEDMKNARAKSDGASGIHSILGGIPVVGPIISGIGKVTGWF